MKRKSNITRYLRAAVTAALLGGIFSLSPAASALPVGGASSTAAIAVNGTTMNITGAANNLITWLDFSIGKGEKVAFDAHNYLNYVTGNAASEILGTLSGQGAIYLVNPNGISIGDGATIDVGTLHLSTADLTGHLNSFSDALSALKGATSFEGDVVNRGTLTAAKEITVQGKNISFKNIDHVKANGSTNNSNIKVYANTNKITIFAYDSNNNFSSQEVPEGEIHVGYKGTTAPTINYISNTTPLALRLISTPQELQNIKDDLNGRYMLENDIDMGGVSDFRPIGYGSYSDTSTDFQGRLDGLNYAIKNLTIEFSAGKNYTSGLFGKIGSSGRVENLILKDGQSNVTGKNHYCGGFVGVHKGILRNVTNDGMTIGGTCVQGGGIAGHNYSLIDGATNNAAITTNVNDQCVGGIVGKNAQATSVIQNSVNTGNITSKKKYIGGIVGWKKNGKVINVSNHGTITGKNEVGGIAGVNASSSDDVSGVASITNAANAGTVTATESKAGGVTGWNGDGGSLSSAYNEGIVTASSERAGGIVGGNTGNVKNVYNTGIVNGKMRNGGIVGANTGNVENVYNTGNVKGEMKNGGIVGENIGIANGTAVIRYAYNTGTVTGTQNIGGIFGLIRDNGKIANAYNASKVEARGTIDSGTADNVKDISQDELHKASTFSVFSLTKDGTDSSAVWRIYEGRTAPLLTAFMTPLVLADTTLLYDGQPHSIASLPNVDPSKIFGGTLPSYTKAGTYSYGGLLSLYSNQSGYNIIAKNDTATLTIEPIPVQTEPPVAETTAAETPVAELTQQLAAIGTTMTQLEDAVAVASGPVTALSVENNGDETDTAAATATTSGDRKAAEGTVPAVPEAGSRPMTWTANGLLTIKSGGVKEPKSMQGEDVAQQQEKKAASDEEQEAAD